MKRIYRHSNILTSIFAVLFFLANSGFTVAILECTMKSDSADMACCRAEKNEMAAFCPMMHHDDVASAAKTDGDKSCHKIFVAGGLQDVSSVLQKEMTPKIAKGDLTVLPAPTNVVAPTLSQSSFADLSSASHVLPSRVQTYVLNSTFLI